jgi:hypothetical protein
MDPACHVRHNLVRSHDHLQQTGSTYVSAWYAKIRRQVGCVHNFSSEGACTDPNSLGATSASHATRPPGSTLTTTWPQCCARLLISRSIPTQHRSCISSSSWQGRIRRDWSAYHSVCP